MIQESPSHSQLDIGCLRGARSDSFGLSAFRYSPWSLTSRLFTVRRIIWYGLTVRLGVATWNAFFGPSFGAEGDAVTFHDAAVAFANDEMVERFSIIGWTYAYMLGLIYKWTTPALIIGGLVSCFMWLASAIVLQKMFRLFLLNAPQQSVAMAIYSFLPSSILFTSVTLREASQALCVNLAIYAAACLLVHRQYRYWILLFIGSVGASLLHMVLLAFGMYVPAATLVFSLLRHKGPWPHRMAAVAVMLVAAFAVVFWLFNRVGYALEDGLVAAVEQFQQDALTIDARTHYKSDVTIDGVPELIVFVAVSVLQYLFEPMPWRSLAVSDLAVVGENLIRLMLIVFAFQGLRQIRAPRHYAFQFTLLMYVVLETLWSLGTVNWGTAVRHHIPAFGMLCALAFAHCSALSEGHKTSLARVHARPSLHGTA